MKRVGKNKLLIKKFKWEGKGLLQAIEKIKNRGKVTKRTTWPVAPLIHCC